MTDETLTEQEALELFNATSKAIRDADTVKLGELNKVQTPVDNKDETDTTVDDNQPDPDKGQPDENDDNKDTPQGDKPAEDKGDDDKKNNEQQPDELTKLREQLETLRKENHAMKSQAGRVPHMQRRLQELDKRLEEFTKAQTSPSSQPSTKLKGKLEEALKGIKETDPDLADAIAKSVEMAIDGVAADTHTRNLEQTKAEREEVLKQYREEQTDELLEMYPNAGEVFNSTHFKQWVSQQSRGIQQLVNSDTAADVSAAFERYAEDMRRMHPELNKQTQAKVEDQPDAEAAARAKQVEAERLRKKQTAAVVNSPTAQGKVEIPDDPKALFEKFSKEIRDARNGK